MIDAGDYVLPTDYAAGASPAAKSSCRSTRTPSTTSRQIHPSKRSSWAALEQGPIYGFETGHQQGRQDAGAVAADADDRRPHAGVNQDPPPTERERSVPRENGERGGVTSTAQALSPLGVLRSKPGSVPLRIPAVP